MDLKDLKIKRIKKHVYDFIGNKQTKSLTLCITQGRERETDVNGNTRICFLFYSFLIFIMNDTYIYAVIYILQYIYIHMCVCILFI